MPIDHALVQSLLDRMQSSDIVQTQPFQLAADLCRAISQDCESPESHELVLRAMEHRDRFGQAGHVLDGLLRQLGLFPYLDPGKLGIADHLAFEAHRPAQMGDQIVFHRAQAYVYRLLLSGENVALSAPTSFGKSLLIDAAIASGRFKNIVIVVPTLALIDETRRRLAGRFRGEFKLITRSSQRPAQKNIYVLTQERVVEKADWQGIDFFVIDEFYKLSPRQDQDRSAILNEAFYILAKTGAQFYMLGPNISGVTEQNHLQVRMNFVHVPHFHTVATQVHRMEVGDDEFQTLVELCRSFDAPTLIFCSSPARASEVARQLTAAQVGSRSTNRQLQQAVEWIAQTYHPEWHFGMALAHGIGVHHGRIPRSLGQYVVRRFNDGALPFLVCTSTLIEGVNTSARNIVIFDNVINREQFDLFTFNNIKGRSGRMFRYFVGHVYVFHDDPNTELPFVDVPALSQSEDTPDSLILQMAESDLTDRSRERRDRFVDQDVLTFEVIQGNRGVDPELQITAARRIHDATADYQAELAWSGFPRYAQLQRICELIMEVFGGARLGGGSARTAPQLTAMIWSLRDRPTTRDMIERQIQYSQSADEAVTRTLDFLRLWAQYQFPRLLRTLSNIQRDVLGRLGRPVGNYHYFASQVENLFLDPGIVMVDEFGIPVDVARRLEGHIARGGNLDETIEQLRRLDLSQLHLSSFERELVADAQAHL